MQCQLASALTLVVPENRSALRALEDFADAILRCDFEVDALYLHGPSGSGKSHLLDALVAALQKDAAWLTICRLSASDFVVAHWAAELLESAQRADLLIIEDAQHLARSFCEAIVRLLDSRWAEGRFTVVSAAAGPGELSHRGVKLPARLISRLAAGLVVGLGPLATTTRLSLLEKQTQHLNIDYEALVWLAHNLRTWRQLSGVARQLEMLVSKERLTAGLVRECFGVGALGNLTIEAITKHVGGHFALSPRQLRSRARARRVLVPRQIGMYLARRLTDHSLDEIGAYYGGRDHTTVLHACAKIERASRYSLELAGAVRQLEAELA